MGFADPEVQFAAVRRISEEIVPEAEFVARLRRSREAGKPLRVKYGMDPTAPDLHLGNAIALHKLKVFQDLGHLPVVIIGDYTAMVGDPSGANKTRPMLSEEQVRHNADTYVAQLSRILDVSRTEIRYNGEWFRGLTFAQTVRLTARATVARMLERDDFALRLRDGVPIGVHELLYPLMQGYDSVMVRADVEIGGSDQKFNLLFGRELQRDEGQDPQVIMTHPILVGLDGIRKMSKSLGNYVGVTEAPREMFGKLMSVPDAAMASYFLWTTDVPDAEAAVLLDPARTHPRAAKEALARAVVTRYHGASAAVSAAEEFRRIFSDGEVPSEMPEVRLGAEDVKDGRVWVVRLVQAAGFAASGGEARRLVRQGGVTLDGTRLEDPEAAVPVRGGEILRVGRRRFARVGLPS